jgi:hypothetical protein
MPIIKQPLRPPVHECPACHQPQTKIQRKLGEERLGSVCYVCSRVGECSLALDLRNIETWVAV